MQYQEGYRDGVRTVMMWMMQHQLYRDMEFPSEFIQWMGETLERETNQLNQLNEEGA
jgi:hypothetical protein